MGVGAFFGGCKFTRRERKAHTDVKVVFLQPLHRKLISVPMIFSFPEISLDFLYN